MNKFTKSLTSAFAVVVFSAASQLSAFPNPDSARPANENWQAPQPTDIVAPVFADIHDGATVHVKLTIDEAGKPSDVQVLFHRDPELTEAVVKAVEQWQFQPAMQDGEAVSVRVVMPVELQLEQSS